MAIHPSWLWPAWLVLTMALAATTARPGRAQPFHLPSTVSVSSLAQATDANPDGQPQDSGRISLRSDRQEMNEEEGILTATGRVRITYPAP